MPELHQHKFDPDMELERHEQAALAMLVTTEGYKVLHRIARAEVDKFLVSLLNAAAEEPSQVLERHRISKTAAQLYEGFTNRINREVFAYTERRASAAHQPVDPTEGNLDFGPHSSRDMAEVQPLEGVGN